MLAFVREHEDERILVVANLSRYAQAVQLDLADMQGVTPIEMFGRTPFPQIGATPYLVTLSPYAFYWFLLPTADYGTTARDPGVQGSGRRLLRRVGGAGAGARA